MDMVIEMSWCDDASPISLNTSISSLQKPYSTCGYLAHELSYHLARTLIGTATFGDNPVSPET